MAYSINNHLKNYYILLKMHYSYWLIELKLIWLYYIINKVGANVMDVFNQYDIFKEKCFGFSEKFEKNCFSQAKLVCHPTVENEIISLCSDEEAKSNGLNICRFSDMLLMSDDNENWNTFNLAEPRQKLSSRSK